MNKFSHIVVAACLGVAVGTAFSGPLDANSRAAVSSETHRDFSMTKVVQTSYDSGLRSGSKEVTLGNSTKSLAVATKPAELRESEHAPLTGPMTLLAGLALICGIAFKRLSA